MKEKELRLAVVCYGGVSLAIYEHGITKEMLKLARASKAYHSAEELKDRQAADRSFQSVAGDNPEYCTEAIYFELLKAIGASLDLRVVIDVISGSSAGGINGITLARALAHDLSLDPLTDMWLDRADIQKLLAPEAKARRWSKWYVRPFIEPLTTRLMREGLTHSAADLEMRAALSTFLRSRWFHPPLDGKGFTTILLDGLQAMGAPRSDGASLLPAEHELDLIVTVTDFYGSARSVFVHDPPVILEREHRHAMRFSFENRPDREMRSDFGDAHLPSLAFAARATASYPGAFPPAQMKEMDAVLADRGQAWPGRGRFIEANFRRYTDLGASPDTAVLVDGSVLNNKPLSEAIAAARTHRAFCEVDRRLVYIDPHPTRGQPESGRTPSFFSTLRGALSDLPRYEPIYDELLEINAYNAQVRERRAVLEAARPQVEALVKKIIEERPGEAVSRTALRRWRLNGPNLIAGAGLIYNGWIRLLIAESIQYIAQLAAKACSYADPSPQKRWIEQVIEAAARNIGVYAASYEFASVERESALPVFGLFIANFGVKYNRRRILFVIRTINQLYSTGDDLEGRNKDAPALDSLKRRLYRCLDALRPHDDIQFLNPSLVSQIRNLFGGMPETAVGEALLEVEAFAALHEAELSALFARLSDACRLTRLNEDVDAALASPAVFELRADRQNELLVSYIGFPFWDIVLLPMGGAQDANLLEEIQVDRISPDDAKSLQQASEGPILRGGGLAGFGGFFSRATRENDYLWGRLHAVERLMDLVASTAPGEIKSAGLDMRALKKRGFELVLRREAARLPLAAALMLRLQDSVAAL